MSLFRHLPFALFALLPGMLAAAETTADGLLHAVAGAPALEAARKRVEASRSRIDSAGRLADPEAEAMVSRGTSGADPVTRSAWLAAEIPENIFRRLVMLVHELL